MWYCGRIVVWQIKQKRRRRSPEIVKVFYNRVANRDRRKRKGCNRRRCIIRRRQIHGFKEGRKSNRFPSNIWGNKELLWKSTKSLAGT